MTPASPCLAERCVMARGKGPPLMVRRGTGGAAADNNVYYRVKLSGCWRGGRRREDTSPREHGDAEEVQGEGGGAGKACASLCVRVELFLAVRC